jgi:hypothetical protein
MFTKRESHPSATEHPHLQSRLKEVRFWAIIGRSINLRPKLKTIPLSSAERSTEACEVPDSGGTSVVVREYISETPSPDGGLGAWDPIPRLPSKGKVGTPFQKIPLRGNVLLGYMKDVIGLGKGMMRGYYLVHYVG